MYNNKNHISVQNLDASQPHSESESRLEAIINTVIDGIITIDSKGIMETVNPAAAHLFGYERDELIGNNVHILMPEPDHSQHNGYIQRYLDTGEQRIIGIGREVTGKKKDGTLFPFRLAISEVNFKENRERIFTGIIHDLTDRKKAEEKNRQYRRRLERSNRDLQDFAYISSHDLQEPLRKIRTFGTHVQNKEADNLSNKGQDYLGRMINAAERMQRLIDDLLSYSRISTKANPFVETDLQKIVQGVCSDLEIAIQKTNANIEFHSLPVIEADPTQMRQLFQNLISNSIKFHVEGKAPHIVITTEPLSTLPKVERPFERAGVQITLQDNGIGFDPQYAQKIFQVFQRAVGREYHGSGIGLAICQRIVNRHGGTIHADSKPGEGSTFVIRLPRQQIVT